MRPRPDRLSSPPRGLGRLTSRPRRSRRLGLDFDDPQAAHKLVLLAALVRANLELREERPPAESAA
ncbi:MAG: hypothetical protein QF903_03410 [Planctomycetota bacterium]|jgi:hypothetical protein|nr:hypothetical protein [Planctomycetota bacterium]MDP6988504.1 hypothetical protein [Planctomycetota bacterium]